MSESYKELEKRISDACDAYSARGNPKIKPLSREFNVPYERLDATLNQLEQIPIKSLMKLKNKH